MSVKQQSVTAISRTSEVMGSKAKGRYYVRMADAASMMSTKRRRCRRPRFS